MLTIPPFVGPFCRSVGGQCTAKRWYTDPLTNICLGAVKQVSIVSGLMDKEEMGNRGTRSSGGYAGIIIYYSKM